MCTEANCSGNTQLHGECDDMATVHVEPVVVTASHNSNEWRQSLDTQTVHPNQSLTRASHMAAAALRHVQSNHDKLT